MPSHRQSFRASGSVVSDSHRLVSDQASQYGKASYTSRSAGNRQHHQVSKPPQGHKGRSSSKGGIHALHAAQRQPGTPSTIPSRSPGGQSAEIQDSIEPTGEIIMAVDLKDGQTVGCAFFETDNGVLLLCTDVPMADLDVMEQLLAHIQPTTVLAPARAPEHLLIFLEERSAAERDDRTLQSGFILRAVSSSEFSLRTAHDRLIALQKCHSTTFENSTLQLGGELFDNMEGSLDAVVDADSRNVRLIRCGTSIDLESPVSVTCAGAVLSEINRRRSIEDLPDGHEAGQLFEITALDMFSLHDSVYITQETLLALQIIQSEQHPNSQISGGVQSASGSKESLSIYGLFHHLAGTPQGRASLRRVFLRPTQNIQVIAERQHFISLFIQPENMEQLKQASKALKKIGNARRVLAQLQKGAESPSTGQSDNRGAWSMLKRFATHTLKLREEIISVKGYTDVALLVRLVECIDPGPIVLVGNMIEKTIDFEDSKERQRSCVRAGVDPHLDEMKRLYDGMSSLLTQVVDHMRANIPEWARQYVRSCIFLPQLGFLTVIESDPATGNGKFEGEGVGAGTWEKLFSSDGVVCYKNSFMKELDEQYGDMYCEIGDREVEIIHDLARRVLKHEELLTTVSDLCGEFDALLALAIGADKYNWSRPQITTDDSIFIEGGRHPLQELVVPCFIPNDCHITGSQMDEDEVQEATAPRALVLTGPNHSGKSVYLKQAATIIYLAQVGSYVPAERAVLGVTDKILARITTRESASRIESAFAIDLKQIAQAMRGATARSLVLVDEFGKGTSSDDGAGLLAALLDHLLGMGLNCPKVLLATHFHEVFEGGYAGHQARLQVAHMEVEIDMDSQHREDDLTYLFKLAPGHSSSSFGGRCAALNGVPGAVVRRAEAISQLIARHEDLVTACSQLSKQEEEDLERAEGTARRFLEVDIEPQALQGQDLEPTKSPAMPMKHLLDQILGEAELLSPR